MGQTATLEGHFAEGNLTQALKGLKGLRLGERKEDPKHSGVSKGTERRRKCQGYRKLEVARAPGPSLPPPGLSRLYLFPQEAHLENRGVGMKRVLFM